MKICFVLSFLCLSACATWDNPGEYAAIRSQPSNAQIRQNGKLVGVTPAIVFIPRGKDNSEFTLSLRGETQSLVLKRKYKWGKSFGRNLIFFSLAPIGWITDLITHAAWQPESNGSVKFSFSDDESDRKKISKGEELAIAPPRSIHPDISDEMAPYIEKEIRRKYPQYWIRPYESTISTFSAFSVDFDNDLKLEDSTQLYGRLGVKKIATSSLNTEGRRTKATIRINDFFSPETDFSTEVELPEESSEIVKKYDWMGVRREYLYWLPNAVFLDFGDSATSLTMDNKDQHRAKSYSSDDFVGKVSSVVSTIGFRRIILPSRRDEWRYRFRLVPTGSFSYAKEVFPTASATIRNIVFTRTHADIGWGPSFNYENFRWNLYFNFLPLVTYDSIVTSNATHDFDFDELGVNFGAELGLMYFFKSGWTLRLYSRSATIPLDLWKKLWPQVSGTNERVDGASFISSGLAIGYVIPNKDLPF